MFDQRPDLRLSNARLVLPGETRGGGVVIEDGRIAAVTSDLSGHDLGDDFLIPGVVDVHTDHVETHVFPRAGVKWALDAALAAHDAVIISGGTTTVFDSLGVGASLRRSERRTLLEPLVAALQDAQSGGRFRARHILHLRCEISDPTTIDLVDKVIGAPITGMVSVMDHTPGDRQSVDVDKWIRRMARDMQVGLDEAQVLLDELFERSRRCGPAVRAHVVAKAKAQQLPLMSHDDRTIDHVDQAHGEGVTVSEFPTTLAAAERAQKLGLAVVVGAPNYLRGGSQSGNVAVRELLEAGVVDVLASDYVPRSPLDAAFAIADDPALPQTLHETVNMVSRTPARLAGLDDCGAIVPGLRADLVQVRRAGGQCHIVAVWRGGQRVY